MYAVPVTFLSLTLRTSEWERKTSSATNLAITYVFCEMNDYRRLFFPSKGNLAFSSFSRGWRLRSARRRIAWLHLHARHLANGITATREREGVRQVRLSLLALSSLPRVAIGPIIKHDSIPTHADRRERGRRRKALQERTPIVFDWLLGNQHATNDS